MPENSVLNLITQRYYQLTASEKKLASFVVANSQQAQRMSISEMSEACETAQATISRFCRKLGYEGFSAFRLAIAAAVAAKASCTTSLSGEITEKDTLTMLGEKVAAAEIDAINETKALLQLDQIQLAADILQVSDTVLCMGQGASMLMAEETAHLFTTMFPGYFAITDSHTQIMAASNLTERDAILYFSYSGSATDLLDLMRMARKRQVKLLLITQYPGSPGAEMADLVLQYGYTASSLQLGAVTARIAQLYLVDVLFSELCRRDMEHCKVKRQQVADVLSDKHLE